MATKKKEDLKKDEVKVEEPLLLTEEEFARRQRKKTKERVNKVIRLVGLVGTFILFYGAIFDILFELSYFGWMWYAMKGVPAETNVHNIVWEQLRANGVYDVTFFGAQAAWLPKLGMTMLLIASIVVVLYLAIYCIIDLIELIRAAVKLGKDLTKDLEATANDGGVSFKKKEKPESEPFTPTKKPNPRRRKDSSLDDMTDAELDAILRGEKVLDKDIKLEKDLFSEDDE